MTKPSKAVARKAPAKRKKRTTAQRLAEVLPAGVNVSMRGDAVFIALDQRLSPDNFASMGGAERVAANVSAVYGVINGLPALPRPVGDGRARRRRAGAPAGAEAGRRG